MDTLLAAMQSQGWFAEAFNLWGAATTWLELIAFTLALAMVACNIKELHWGWPLAIVSSLLYFALFYQSKLYGDAALQIFFAVISVWGWSQWLRHSTQGVDSLKPTRMARSQQAAWLLAFTITWPLTGLYLKQFTDTDVPWWDAFPTAGSVIGQLLLGRKLIENWLVWIGVNGVGMSLFAYKGLWLTALLYAIFSVLSLVGWRAWKTALDCPQRIGTITQTPSA